MVAILDQPASDAPVHAPTREVIHAFLADCRLRNLSARSLEWYDARLQRLFLGLMDDDISTITIPTIRTQIADMIDRLAPATVNGYLRTARAFFNWALDEGYDVRLRPRKLPRLKEPKKVPPVLSIEQIRALLAQPDKTRFVGLRDFTMMMVAIDTGIRLSEIIGLAVFDFDGELLRVSGKGNKERLVALSAAAVGALRRYLHSRQQALAKAGVDTAALFPSRQGRRLDRKMVYDIVNTHAKNAGIEGVRVSPHTLRYTFATHFLRNGGGIVNLQQILGHTTLTMSRHYALVADEDAFAASRQMSPIALLNGASTFRGGVAWPGGAENDRKVVHRRWAGRGEHRNAQQGSE